MRFGVGCGIALLMCSAGGTFAEDAAKGKTTEEVVKLASAGNAAAGGEKPQSAVVVTPPVTRTAKPKPVKRKRVSPSLVARIDLNAQRMRVTSNGKLVGSWSISSGKYKHETPAGSFRPKWTSKMHYSRQYNNSPMPYSVFFNGGIATHGTNYTGRLGSAASHGCIRLRTGNARKFYNLVQRHGYKRTRIIVTGRAKINRTASKRRSRRSTSRRRNSFSAPVAQWNNAYSGRRSYSVRQYDRARLARHRARVKRYYQSRRRVYPGDRR